MKLMESYYYYLLSISFGYVFCLQMLRIKVYRKKSVGKHTTTTEWNLIVKIMKFRKQWTKNHTHQSWTKTGPRVGCPASYMGQPAHHSTASLRASSTVRFEPNTLYFHMFRFSFDKQLQNLRKDYFSHDLRIDSHNTFPGSLSTIGNLLLGTPCHLSCCGMRYSRIMRT